MAKTAPRTIILKGSETAISEECPAGGAITPGHLINKNSSGAFVVQATASVAVVPRFAVENDLVGKGIDDAYASGDFVQSRICQPGTVVNALVAAAAVAITAGDLLEAHTDGTVKKASTGVAIAKAEETLDNSGGASPARLKIMVI